MNLFIFTDGGSRGNPGEAAIGVYITNDKKEVLAKIGKRIGVATNNIAEYRAIIEGLTWITENIKNLKDLKITFFLDSQLAYSQICGIYKIKNQNLRELLFKIREIEQEIKTPIFYNFVRRELNKNADKLVNMALDNEL